jgi:formate dehydrogenase maturation protein FdhE
LDKAILHSLCDVQRDRAERAEDAALFWRDEHGKAMENWREAAERADKLAKTIDLAVPAMEGAVATLEAVQEVAQRLTAQLRKNMEQTHYCPVCFVEPVYSNADHLQNCSLLGLEELCQESKS